MNSSFHCIIGKKLAMEMAKFAKFFVENLRTNWSKMATKFRAPFYLTNYTYTCSDKFKQIFLVILISYFERTFHNCFKIVLQSNWQSRKGISFSMKIEENDSGWKTHRNKKLFSPGSNKNGAFPFRFRFLSFDLRGDIFLNSYSLHRPGKRQNL